MRPNKATADVPVNGGSLTSILTVYAVLKAATLQSGKKGRRPVAARQARINSRRSDSSTQEDQNEARIAYEEVEPTGVLEDGDRLLKELSEQESLKSGVVGQLVVWLREEIRATLRDALDTSALLSYLLELLRYCQQDCNALLLSLTPLNAGVEDPMSAKIMHLTENAEQKAQLGLWSKLIGVICEIILELDVEGPCNIEPLVTGPEWLQTIIGLLEVSRGGSMLSYDTTVSLSEILWSISEDNPERTKELLADAKIIGLPKLGRLFAESQIANTSLHLARVIVKSLPSKLDLNRLAACQETFKDCQDILGHTSVVKRIVSRLGSILATASWAPKEYMRAINAAAEADITGRYRPKGFTLTDALVGEKPLLGSAKCQQRLKKGDVIIYIDQMGLLLKAFDAKGVEEDLLLFFKNMRDFKEGTKHPHSFVYWSQEEGATKRNRIELRLHAADSVAFKNVIHSKLGEGFTVITSDVNTGTAAGTSGDAKGDGPNTSRSGQTVSSKKRPEAEHDILTPESDSGRLGTSKEASTEPAMSVADSARTPVEQAKAQAAPEGSRNRRATRRSDTKTHPSELSTLEPLTASRAREENAFNHHSPMQSAMRAKSGRIVGKARPASGSAFTLPGEDSSRTITKPGATSDDDGKKEKADVEGIGTVSTKDDSPAEEVVETEDTDTKASLGSSTAKAKQPFKIPNIACNGDIHMPAASQSVARVRTATIRSNQKYGSVKKKRTQIRASSEQPDSDLESDTAKGNSHDTVPSSSEKSVEHLGSPSARLPAVTLETSRKCAVTPTTPKRSISKAQSKSTGSASSDNKNPRAGTPRGGRMNATDPVLLPETKANDESCETTGLRRSSCGGVGAGGTTTSAAPFSRSLVKADGKGEGKAKTAVASSCQTRPLPTEPATTAQNIGDTHEPVLPWTGSSTKKRYEVKAAGPQSALFVEAPIASAEAKGEVKVVTEEDQGSLRLYDEGGVLNNQSVIGAEAKHDANSQHTIEANGEHSDLGEVKDTQKEAEDCLQAAIAMGRRRSANEQNKTSEGKAGQNAPGSLSYPSLSQQKLLVATTPVVRIIRATNEISQNDPLPDAMPQHFGLSTHTIDERAKAVAREQPSIPRPLPPSSKDEQIQTDQTDPSSSRSALHGNMLPRPVISSTSSSSKPPGVARKSIRTSTTSLQTPQDIPTIVSESAAKVVLLVPDDMSVRASESATRSSATSLQSDIPISKHAKSQIPTQKHEERQPLHPRSDPPSKREDSENRDRFQDMLHVLKREAEARKTMGPVKSPLLKLISMMEDQQDDHASTIRTTPGLSSKRVNTTIEPESDEQSSFGSPVKRIRLETKTKRPRFSSTAARMDGVKRKLYDHDVAKEPSANKNRKTAKKGSIMSAHGRWDEHETEVMQLLDSISEEVKSHVRKRIDVPNRQARLALSQISQNTVTMVEQLRQGSVEIKNGIDRVLNGSNESHGECLQAYQAITHDMQNLVKTSRKAYEIGKKGYGGTIPKMLIPVPK